MLEGGYLLLEGVIHCSRGLFIVCSRGVRSVMYLFVGVGVVGEGPSRDRAVAALRVPSHLQQGRMW